MENLIFVIDDDEAYLRQMQTGLERAGYQVRTAVNGEDALERIKGTRPRAIILDLDMPGMNGITFLKIVKGDRKARAIPVIVVSGRQDYESIWRSYDLGSAKVLSKPVEFPDLLRELQEVLGPEPGPEEEPSHGAAAPIREPSRQKTEGGEPRSPAAKKPTSKPKKGKGKQETILVIDDEVAHLRQVRLGLIREGYRVETARDGEEGIRKMGKKRPRVIVLDLEMPGMDGYEFMRVIKGHPAVRDIPIIILSGLDEAEHMFQAYDSGSELFLSKPLDMPKLLEAIENVKAWRR